MRRLIENAKNGKTIRNEEIDPNRFCFAYDLDVPFYFFYFFPSVNCYLKPPKIFTPNTKSSAVS